MRILLFGISFIAFSFASRAQTYCTAGSNGAGNLFGGNVTSLIIEDDTGILYSYIGLTNNSSASVINSGSSFSLVSWDSFVFSLAGVSDSTGNSMYTKAGIWLDKNRDGNFSADECIADPVSGPFNHLRKDSLTTKTLRMPGPFTVGASRMRIRGAANNQTLTASDGCGSLNVYGNQFDFELTLIQGTNQVNNIAKAGDYFLVYPNPAAQMVNIKSSLKLDKNAWVYLTDLAGKVILKELRGIADGEIVKLDVSTVPNGIYTLHVVSAQTKLVRKLQISNP